MAAGEAAGDSGFGLVPVQGERLGENDRFEIVDKLGAGGMGHVFRALDRHLDRTVAIKFILQTADMPLEQLVTMLKREAKATAQLNHENIVAIFDMDTYAGVPFLVMEMLHGQSLDVMLERSRLSPLRATQIMTQVARGLAHAHERGIVHRDLKPSNVFILRDGRAKILDFGISRFERSVQALAVAGELGPTIIGVGTPPFMAPEQWRIGPQDARTDIWAAGVMFYQLLTGKLPYSLQELRRFAAVARVRRVAPSVKLLVPSLPEEADRIVGTSLNEDPEGRFQTARELQEALSQLERVLSGADADPDGRGGGAWGVERRLLTVVACSLESGADLVLDDIIEIDQRFYQVSANVVKRWDGNVGLPVGGRTYCCFGYPVAKETDAQRAVLASLEILEAMREPLRGDPRGLHVKIGIHSGMVGLPNLSGIGSALPAMQGSVPNVATRLREDAAPDSVVISQATLDRTGGSFRTDRLDRDARVDRGAAPVYRVLGARESESRFEQGLTAAQTPLVGRDAEIDALFRLWDEVKEGRGQIVVVSGEPGIGKSRLVQALKSRVTEERNTRLSCQCWPHFRNSALYPLIQLLLRSMDIQREDPPESRLEKLSSGLATLGFSLPETVPLFGALLTIPFEPRYPPLGLPPEQQKIKTLEAMASMLRRMSVRCPVLFLIEDMQWVDHSTIEFLNVLVDLVPSARLLVVLTGRREFRAPWSARKYLHHLALDRLSAAATATMIAQSSGEQPFPEDMVGRLVAITDGVPLFVEELTRMVIESWQPSDDERPSGRIAIPATLHELLLARLDRLRGVGKEVAQIGSILGREFDYELVRRISPLDEMSLEDGLEALVAAGILLPRGKPPESSYVFRHALIQQTAYQSQLKSKRQHHHLRAAKLLVEVFPETAELQPELIAYHHSEGGNPAEAFPFWEKAGRRATQRSALVEAIDHFRAAQAMLAALPEAPSRDSMELSLLLALGSPLMAVYGYASPEVQKNYGRARELARTAGGRAELVQALNGLWQFYMVRGMLPASRDLGEQLLDIATSSGDATFLLLARRAFATSVFLQGDPDLSRQHTRAGLDIYDSAEHGTLSARAGTDPGVAHGVYQAWALWILGYPDQSLRCVLDAVSLAGRLAHPATSAFALCYAAVIRNCRGERVEAKALSEAALSICVEHKLALWLAWARMDHGWSLAGLGRPDEGIAEMKEGIEGWTNTGARAGLTFFPITLAEICLHAGRFDEMGVLLDEAAKVVAGNDEHFCEAELLRLQGELALRRGRAGAEGVAAACFERGVAVARAQKAESWALRLAMSQGALLAAQGLPDLAARGIRETLGRFTEGGETGDHRQAKAQIESLSSWRIARRTSEGPET